jgi:transcription initiation factor TFIIB
MSCFISNTMTAFSKRKCPRCTKNSIILDEELDELFCSDCGYVITEKYEAESRVTSDKPSNEKTKRSWLQSMSNIGSQTKIGSTNKDSSGKQISANQGSFERLRKLESKTRTNSSERNLQKAKKEMSRLQNVLALSDVIMGESIRMYQKIIDRKLTRGYLINAHVGACIYASCKITETPRTMGSIANSLDIKKIEIRRSYKMMVKELELKIPLTDPVSFVARIASEVGFGEKTKREAIKMIEQAKKTGIVIGKEPRGIVAGALHIAGFKTEEPKTEKTIAEASGIAVGTLIARSKDFEEITEW